MAGALFSRVKTWSAGDTLTAADLNAEFDNILNNLTPANIDDEAASAAAHRATDDPYSGAAQTVSTSLQEDIQQLRYQILAILGSDQTYWYEDPTEDLSDMDDIINQTDGTIPVAVQNQTYQVVTGTGADTITASDITPSIQALTTGMRCVLKVGTVNTGAATLAIGTAAAKSIKKHHDQALVAGDLEAGAYVDLVYDGTNFQTLSSLGITPGMATTYCTSITSAGSGTYTVPTNVKSLIVELWGGGGGGATDSTAGASGGGGGGGYLKKTYSVTPAAEYTYTVGAGGAGGAVTDNNGAVGTASTFDDGGTAVTAGGGAAGTCDLGDGGAGGVGTGGDVIGTGGHGGPANSGHQTGAGGMGAFGGAGGPSQKNATGVTGYAGQWPGGGGGGGANAGTGGAGAAGGLIITAII